MSTPTSTAALGDALTDRTIRMLVDQGVEIAAIAALLQIPVTRVLQALEARG